MRLSGLALVSAAITITVMGAGCAEPPPPPAFKIAVRVEGDPGRPLANAQITRSSKALGVTNIEGKTTLAIDGVEGEIADVVVTCPEGYLSPNKALSIKLTRLADNRIPEYAVTCPPSMRRVVVAIRADNGPNLPVVYLNRPVTRTDASGAASFALEVPPGSQFSVALDTGDRKDMKPNSPQRIFVVNQQDEVFLFDQRFEIEKKARPVVAGPFIPKALN